MGTRIFFSPGTGQSFGNVLGWALARPADR